MLAGKKTSVATGELKSSNGIEGIRIIVIMDYFTLKLILSIAFRPGP